MNKKLVLLGAAMLMTAGVASAQKRVTGKVLDADGNPLVGASVRVEGVQKVTMTDDQGNFKLTDVPASAKRLLISYIGYETQNVSIASDMKVVMKDNNVLDEAVVIGYGSARKIGTVVGSVSKVDGEKISAMPTANIADAMQGQVAGLQVFNNTGDVGEVNTTSFYIRGIGSLEASNEPLVVVDGTPVGSSVLSLMNSGDIESITTLKDASATSIYGSRAANGVIYIVTKKGRKGEANAEVTVGQKVGWSQLARRIGNPMNATEYLGFALENGLITASQYAEYKTHGANTDWQDYYFRNDAPLYETDFSIRGGSQKTSYFVSGSYLDNTGVDDESHMQRYNVRANLDAQVNDWLKFGVNQNIVYTDRMYNGYTYNGASNIRSYSSAAAMFLPYWDPYDPESRKNHQILYMGSYDTKWLNDLQPGTINDIIYNGNAYLQLNPIKGLTLKSQLGLYATNTNSKFSVLAEFPDRNGIASTKRSDSRSSMWTITNTAEYRFNIGDDHEFTLLAGQEGIKYNSDAFGAGAKGSTDDRLLTISNMTEATISDVSESTSAYQFLSFFGRLDYSLMNRYFANFTVRNDQSSRFGAKNRSAMFYSGGLMWNMRNENFMQDLYWLDALDVRVSVGSTGNAGIGNYASLGLVGSTQYNGEAGWVLTQPSNEELGWEKQIQTNVGFSASIFSRFNFEFNFYHRKTKDMLMEVPLPYTTGFSSQMMNVGELSNRGVELSASYDIIKRKDLLVSVRANYAYNTNQIDKLFYGKTEWPMPGKLLNYKVGESLNYYMPIYAGVDKNDGAPMWYKKGHKGGVVHEFNPETMTKDASNMDALNQDTGKKRFAPHTGGFGLTAQWKGFTLSTDFAFVAGKYMVNNSYLWVTDPLNISNGANPDRDMLNMWKKPGDLAVLPGFNYSSQFDTHLLENASFLRMKNLTLAYNLPSQWMEATGFMKAVRLSFTGRNLFTVTGYRGADPEIDTNIQYGAYPATRQFVLGVDVTF
jgi:TonB-linked SusC/RagA family outer membrane protein